MKELLFLIFHKGYNENYYLEYLQVSNRFFPNRDVTSMTQKELPSFHHFHLKATIKHQADTHQRPYTNEQHRQQLHPPPARTRHPPRTLPLRPTHHRIPRTNLRNSPCPPIGIRSTPLPLFPCMSPTRRITDVR